MSGDAPARPFPSPPPAAAGRGHRWLLALLLLVGLALRVAYGWGGTHHNRFWDERYAFENVHALAVKGTTLTPRGFYASPLFFAPVSGLALALERLHERTGDARWDALEDGAPQPALYRAARAWTALLAVAGIGLLYLLGRRLRGPDVGLLAAALLTFLPWHLHMSGYFKPDAMLITAIVAALYATVRTLETASWRWGAVTGLAIAAAASAKLTGVVAAFPLALGTVLLGPGDRRRWRNLAVAATVSALSFLLFNPHWRLYPGYMERLKSEYEYGAFLHGTSRWDVTADSLALFAGRWVHSPPGAWLAGGGALFLLIAALPVLRRPAASATRARAAATLGLLSFAPIWLLVYVTQTNHFKPNNVLPILPVTCLCLAFALRALWRGVRHLVPPRWRGRAGTGAWLALAALVVPPGWNYVYRQSIPHTRDLAERFLRRPMTRSDNHVVLAERMDVPEPAWHGRRPIRGLRHDVERLDGVDPGVLESADGWIFHSRRLFEPGASWHARAMTSVDRKELRTLSPRWFRARGPELVVVRRLFQPSDGGSLGLAPCADGTPRCLVGSLRDAMTGGESPQPGAFEPGRLVSLQISIPARPYSPPGELPAILVAGQPRTVHLISVHTYGHTFTTERFSMPRGQARTRLELPDAHWVKPPGEGEIGWTSWQRGSGD